MRPVWLQHYQYRLLIDGKFVNAVSGKSFPTLNPATGKAICSVAEADKADLDLAVEAARRAFLSWSRTDASIRRDLMLKLAMLMEQNADELATIEAIDAGKPFAEALVLDLALSVKCLRYYAGWADKIQGKTIPVDGNYFSFTKHQPLGVVGMILPWCNPVLMAIWKLGPALAMGCTVILKPAPQTPLSVLRLGEFINQAGFPPGVVNILSGFGPTLGRAMAEHRDIDKITFTGSTDVGRMILAGAANSNMKKVSLDLGGKSPLIVCDDADLEQAVSAAMVGVFLSEGQLCTASSRVYVQSKIHDEFVRRLVVKTRECKQGDPLSNVAIGPQVSQEQLDLVLGYLAKGKAEGANCECGGLMVDGPGFFVMPTIFTNVRDDMTIAQQEILGPVMSILKFDTLDEAIDRANETHYGLAAGIMTRNMAAAFKFADRANVGTVWINAYNIFDCAQPFGGCKESGMGRQLGEYALAEYTSVKTVMMSLDDLAPYNSNNMLERESLREALPVVAKAEPPRVPLAASIPPERPLAAA